MGAAWLIPKCYETIIYGILLDALYGTEYGIWGFPYMFTAGSATVFLLASIIRKRVMW